MITNRRPFDVSRKETACAWHRGPLPASQSPMYFSRNEDRLPSGSAAPRKAANFESLLARAGTAIHIHRDKRLNSRSSRSKPQEVSGRDFDYIKLLGPTRPRTQHPTP